MAKLTKPTFTILKNCGCLGSGKGLTNKNFNSMKNEEQEPLICSGITYQPADEENDLPIVNNYGEVSDEEPMLPNEALISPRKYLDDVQEGEQPLAFNAKELK